MRVLESLDSWRSSDVICGGSLFKMFFVSFILISSFRWSGTMCFEEIDKLLRKRNALIGHVLTNSLRLVIKNPCTKSDSSRHCSSCSNGHVRGDGATDVLVRNWIPLMLD